MCFLYKLLVVQFVVIGDLPCLSYGQNNDIFSAIINGVDTGINIIKNGFDAGIRNFMDDGPLANNDNSISRQDAPQLYQNQHNYQSTEEQSKESEEPYNNNSEQRQEEDSSKYQPTNSEEYHKNVADIKEEKEHFHVNNDKTIQKHLNISKHLNNLASPLKQNLQKDLIRKDVHEKDHDLVPIEEKKGNLTSNKNNITPNITNDINILNDIVNKTSAPLVILVNSTLIENALPKIPVINNTTINLNSTEHNDKVVTKHNNTKILKPITKIKFFFQARPVRPTNVISANETVYYVD